MNGARSLSLPIIGLLLLLVVGWLEWRTAWPIPWGLVLVAVAILLFLIRLRQQWRPPTAPRWPSRPLRLPHAVLGQFSRHFELVVFVLLAGAILPRVLLPPVVGLADNGDFGELMDQIGLQYLDPASYDKPFQFVNLHFLAYQPPASEDGGYFSSELILVNAALLLNKLVSTDGLFDLRVLGALHAAALLAGLLLVLAATRSLPKPSRWIGGSLLLLVFTDVGYVAYLNSLYREPAALIFLILAVACALYYIRAPRAGLVPLLAYFAAATLFVSAEPQYAPLGLLLVGFGLLLSRRWSRWSFPRAAAIAMAVVVCGAVAACSYFLQPTSLREESLYNHVFADLLQHSPAPESDLADLGLGSDLIRWVGTDAYAEDAPLDSPAFRENFFGQVTHLSLLEFYATHPARLASMLDRAAGEGFSLRPGNIGNFEETSGLPPGAQSHAFDIWSNAREAFPVESLGGLVAVFGFAAGAAVTVRSRCDTQQDKMLAELFLLLLAMAAAEFVVACVGGGALDIVKHLFVFNLLVDMAVIMTASYVGKWWANIVR